MKFRRSMFLLALQILANESVPRIPQVISYHSILTDASGTPVPDGPAELTFRDEQGNSSQTFLSTGEALHSAGKTIYLGAPSLDDTTHSSLKAPAADHSLKHADHPAPAVKGYSANGIAIERESVSGLGVF